VVVVEVGRTPQWLLCGQVSLLVVEMLGRGRRQEPLTVLQGVLVGR
jgi:hypothetical protein